MCYENLFRIDSVTGLKDFPEISLLIRHLLTLDIQFAEVKDVLGMSGECLFG